MDPLNTPQSTPPPVQPPMGPTPPVPQQSFAPQAPVEVPLNPQPPLESTPPIVPIAPVQPIDPLAPAAATFAAEASPSVAPGPVSTQAMPVMDGPAPAAGAAPGFAPQPSMSAPPATAFGPAMGAPQFGTMAASSAPAPSMAGKKFLTRKKTSLISSVIVVAIILIGVISPLFTVTSADYRDAVSAVNDTVDAYNAMADSDVLSSLESSNNSSQVTALETSHDKFEASYKKLNGLKAIQRDKEVNQAYTTLDAKKPKFETAYETVLEAGKDVSPAIAPINDVTSSNIASTLTSVRSNLASLSLTQQANKDYVSKLLPLLDQAISAAKAGNASQLSSVANELTAADDAWGTAINDLTDAGELKDQINSLGQIVQRKQ